jgi:hypothetical protein
MYNIYNMKVIIFRVEMHLEGVRSTTYLAIVKKVGENLLRAEQ